LGEDLAVAGGLAFDAGGQVLQRGQRIDLLFHLAHGLAVEVDGDGDVAAAVEAVDLRGAAGGGDLGHGGERHAAAAGGGHAQLAEQGRVGQRFLVQLHADRHLALGQVELGQELLVVAAGGHARGGGDVGGGHAQVGGARS